MVDTVRRITSVQAAAALLSLLLLLACILSVPVYVLWYALLRLDYFLMFIAFCFSLLILVLMAGIGYKAYQLMRFGTIDIKLKEIMLNLVIFMCIAGFIFKIFC